MPPPDIYQQSRPLTLADLISQSINTGGGANAPPQASQPPQAPSVDTGQITPQQRSALLEALFQPEPVGPPPEMEKKSAGKVLAGSFADAFNNIATIYGGADLRSNYLQQYMNQLERQKAEQSQYQERKGKSEVGAKQRKAAYLLGEDTRATDRILGEKQRLTEKGEAAKALQEKRSYDESQAAIENQRDVEKEAAKQANEVKKEQIRAAAGIAEERIREGIRTKDAYAKEQNDRLEKAFEGLGVVTENVKPLLATMTPAQIRSKISRDLKQLRLGEDAMAVARQYIEEEIEPTLQLADYYDLEDQQREIDKGKQSTLEGRQRAANQDRFQKGQRERRIPLGPKD